MSNKENFKKNELIELFEDFKITYEWIYSYYILEMSSYNEILKEFKILLNQMKRAELILEELAQKERGNIWKKKKISI